MQRRSSIGGAVLFFVAAALVCVSIAAPGVAAIGAFRSLPTLGLELPAYRAYAAGDSAVMGRVAAGFVLEDLFRVTTWTSTLLAVIAGAAWIGMAISAGDAVRRWPSRIALVALLVLIGAAGLANLEEPSFSSALAEYRAHAREGRRAEADDAKARFDEMHRRAEAQRQAQFGAALLAIASGAAAIAPARRSRAPSQVPGSGGAS